MSWKRLATKSFLPVFCVILLCLLIGLIYLTTTISKQKDDEKKQQQNYMMIYLDEKSGEERINYLSSTFQFDSDKHRFNQNNRKCGGVIQKLENSGEKSIIDSNKKLRTCSYKCKSNPVFVENFLKNSPREYRAILGEVEFGCRSIETSRLRHFGHSMDEAYEASIVWAEEECGSTRFRLMISYFWKSELKRDEWKNSVGVEKNSRNVCSVDINSLGCKHGNSNVF